MGEKNLYDNHYPNLKTKIIIKEGTIHKQTMDLSPLTVSQLKNMFSSKEFKEIKTFGFAKEEISLEPYVKVAVVKK